MALSPQKPEYGKTTAGIAAIILLSVTTLVAFAPTAHAAAPYQPPELGNAAVQSATLQVALEYANALPGLDAKTLRWYLYAIEHRESTFSTTFCNYNDGAGSWNSAIPSSSWPTSDHLPHGCGLTQLTGWTHSGMPFPGNSGSASTSVGKGIYGTVTAPRPITALSDPFDPVQNLRRFMSEEVLPDYVAIKKVYPSFSVDELLRAVAFHWNKGEYTSYQPSNCDYLCLYDTYVARYKPAVLADTAWPGGATPTPPPAPAPAPAPAPIPAPAPSPTPGSASFVVGPHVNEWWIEVSVPGASSVAASVNGAAPIALTLASWGQWVKSTHVVAGSSVVFTATVNGNAATSGVYSWLGAAPAPTPAPAPAPAPSPVPTGTATFAVSPNINSWWLEVRVSPSASGVTASVEGGAPIALRPTAWGSWAISAPVPHGAHVVFSASVAGATATSGATTWP